MKHKFGILLVTILLMLPFFVMPEDSGFASAAAAETVSIFSAIPPVFSFSSGVGGWSTDLYMNPDGTFTGYYHDSDMGDTGIGYPKGTRYECTFNGKFTEVYQISEYEYSMKLEYLNLDKAPEQKTIVDGVRIITSDPYGLDDAYAFRLYLPGRTTADLPEPFLDWMRAPGEWDDTPTLQVYGLYNIGGEQGFYAVAEGSGVSMPPAAASASVVGYVNTDKTNLRFSPVTYGKAIGWVMRGDRVEILGVISGGGENWYHVRLHNVIIGDDYVYGDFEGYILTRLVDAYETSPGAPQIPPASTYGYINKDKTNLRPFPITSGKATGWVMKGDSVEILEIITSGGKNWYHVRVKNVIIGDGYVNGNFEGYILTELVDMY